MVQAPDAAVPQPLKGFLPGGAHAVNQRGVEGAPHGIELWSSKGTITDRSILQLSLASR